MEGKSKQVPKTPERRRQSLEFRKDKLASARHSTGEERVTQRRNSSNLHRSFPVRVGQMLSSVRIGQNSVRP